jgi:hypothetical protein
MGMVKQFYPNRQSVSNSERKYRQDKYLRIEQDANIQRPPPIERHVACFPPTFANLNTRGIPYRLHGKSK